MWREERTVTVYSELGLPYTATRGCDGHTKTSLKSTILEEMSRALTPTYTQHTVWYSVQYHQ